MARSINIVEPPRRDSNHVLDDGHPPHRRGAVPFRAHGDQGDRVSLEEGDRDGLDDGAARDFLALVSEQRSQGRRPDEGYDEPVTGQLDAQALHMLLGSASAASSLTRAMSSSRRGGMIQGDFGASARMSDTRGRTIGYMATLALAETAIEDRSAMLRDDVPNLEE